MDQGKRLLIVDDEQKVSECLQAFFSSKGFDATCAFTGEAALERLGDCPDVVLLDIHLPGVSGLDVLKQAKTRCPTARFIMVSGSDNAEYEEEARRHGARGYIRKPFDFSDVTWAPVFSPA